MNTITVNKAELINTITANRDAHKAEYEKALVRFQERAIEELEELVARARRGHDIKLHVSLPVPEEHTADYDMALEMCKWAQGDTITLEEDDFRQYVLNQWGWARSFAANTQSYVGR